MKNTIQVSNIALRSFMYDVMDYCKDKKVKAEFKQCNDAFGEIIVFRFEKDGIYQEHTTDLRMFFALRNMDIELIKIKERIDTL